MRSRKEVYKLLEPRFDDRRLCEYPAPSNVRDEIIVELLLDIRDYLAKSKEGKNCVE